MRQVGIDWAPAYELLVSLQAFAARSDHKTLELGLEWLEQVRQRVDPDLVRKPESVIVLEHAKALNILIRQCPGERDAPGFVDWLSATSLGELYERLEPHILLGREELLSDLARMRESSVALLTAWNEQYFRGLDPAILAGLRADAEIKRDLARFSTPDELLEAATTGILFSDVDSSETILLVPQYHYRPWNVYSEYRGWRLFLYPADALPANPDEPPPGLLRVTRALSDPNRLRILRHLAHGPRRFTELVQLTGLSKSTVHHHMVTLRAARLVHVHEHGARLCDPSQHGDEAGSRGDDYSLRPNTLEELGTMFSSYLQGDGRSPASRLRVPSLAAPKGARDD